jgi:hypothetical protein
MLNPEELLATISELVKVLGPLESEDRQRAVQSAWMVLKERPLETKSVAQDRETSEAAQFDIPQKARVWAKQNSVTAEQLQHVFDIASDQVSVIAPEILGNSNSEKTINAYILAGIANFLATGDPAFTDKAARSLCETFGCYDSNHSKYMKEKGNNFTGSKAGWKLTAPGLKHAAAMVKELAGAADA